MRHDQARRDQHRRTNSDHDADEFLVHRESSRFGGADSITQERCNMTPAAVARARARSAGWWPRANANPTMTVVARMPRTIHLMPVTLQPAGDIPQAHSPACFTGNEKKPPSPTRKGVKAGGLRSIRSRLLARLALQVIHRINRDLVPGYGVAVTHSSSRGSRSQHQCSG